MSYGPAFPIVAGQQTVHALGLTKHEWYVGQALTGLCSAFGDVKSMVALSDAAKNEGMSVSDFIADTAVEAADSIIKRLNKKP